MKRELLSDIKNQIKTGDLLAFRVRRYDTIVSFFLKLYQSICRVKFSHVGIALRFGEDLFIVEAVMPKVTITPIISVKEFYHIPVELKAEEKNQVDFLISYVGKKYSLLDLITHYLGMDQRETSLYCSEMCSAFYYDMGYLKERESGHTPDKLVKAVMIAADVDSDVHVIVDRGNL